VWYVKGRYHINGRCKAVIHAVMLTKPAGHEAKAKAEDRKSEAEDEAEAQNFFRGRGRGQVRPRLRPRPNDLASRPHGPRGLNIPGYMTQKINAQSDIG